MTSCPASRLAFATLLAVVWCGSLHAEPRSPEHCDSGELAEGSSPLRDLSITHECRVKAGTYAFDEVRVKGNGKLVFDDARILFTTSSIVVEAGGAMVVGTDSAPIGSANIGNQVLIRFEGERVPRGDSAMQERMDRCEVIDKGIAVMQGGSLEMRGARGVPARGGVSWTHLAAAAGPSSYETMAGIGAAVKNGRDGTRIVLAKRVDSGASAWQEGDWIVIASTSFSPFESEFAQIKSFEPFDAARNGWPVVLAQPLKYYHFGGEDPGPAAGSTPGVRSESYAKGAAANFGVDERAEVGLITRNVRLTATTDDAVGSKTRNWGGETKACMGFSKFVLEGVELEKFGKEALGSYPVHFHMDGAVTNQRVSANSVHHSYNKCMTIHMSDDIALDNNVCARVTGHAFYQEMGHEPRTKFVNNLVVGVMNHNFGLPAGSLPYATPGWWDGDNMAASIGYTGLGIRNLDRQDNPTHGKCYMVDANIGRLIAERDPHANNQPYKPCDQTDDKNPEYYYEPPTGFWIINPSASLEGNSVAGCQGLGRGYWYLPPTDYSQNDKVVNTYTVKNEPVGTFRNNRVHGCFDGIFGEPEGAVVSEQLFPKVGGDPKGFNLLARFDGFTASRIRNRAIWMRPMWFVFDNARVATNRKGVSLVTSGGLDGNAPGGWELLVNSVVMAMSTNNVDRWGPCPTDANGNWKVGPMGGAEMPGCVDMNPNAKDAYEKGYPSPFWNMHGFYIYDGPVRIHDTRFVNFLKSPKPLMTDADGKLLDKFNSYAYSKSAPVYEGDAALGWFESNQSAYPTATEVRGLEFVNTDLRHQIYTEHVNLAKFNDGDKNTAVIDIDGSLSGYMVLDAAGQKVAGTHPISLNNLPFNASSNSVDECDAIGAADEKLQGIATSLMSPGNMATLEFSALWGDDGSSRGPLVDGTYQLTQFVTFTRDSLYPSDDAGNTEHASMTLHSRNNQGLWEPKVTHAMGYTVTASVAIGEDAKTLRPTPGIPRYINVGLTDVVKPNMDADPFYTRLGVCYTNVDKSHPKQPKFHIERGYKSWGGAGAETINPTLRLYFNKLSKLYDGQSCENFDYLSPPNLDPTKGCPADGVVIKAQGGACPTGFTKEATDADNKVACIFETSPQLVEEPDFATFSKIVGGKPDFTKYHYDSNTGMLFFYVVQNQRNAEKTSPIGSCIEGSDPGCPKDSESTYGCPPQGCTTYTVEIADASYAPGPSTCGADGTGAYNPSMLYKTEPKFVLPEPVAQNQLAYVGTIEPVVAKPAKVTIGHESFSHRVPGRSPVCKSVN